MRYENYITLVESLLAVNPNATQSRQQPFRLRAAHIRRVWIWSRRLLAVYPDADSHIVQLAAIFHDVGYCRDMADHPAAGADIVREILPKTELLETVEQVARMVLLHADKSRDEMPIEEQILHDADLLDEMGALNIVWDSMAEGAQTQQRYEKTLARLESALPKVCAQSHKLRTAEGRRLHGQRTMLQSLFARELAFELGADIENPLSPYLNPELE